MIEKFGVGTYRIATDGRVYSERAVSDLPPGAWPERVDWWCDDCAAELNGNCGCPLCCIDPDEHGPKSLHARPDFPQSPLCPCGHGFAFHQQRTLPGSCGLCGTEDRCG